MKLILVTFDIDLTQFLIDTEGQKDPVSYAISKAIEINKSPALGYCDEEIGDAVCDRANYSYIHVDMNMLMEILNRHDDWGMLDGVIVYA